MAVRGIVYSAVVGISLTFTGGHVLQAAGPWNKLVVFRGMRTEADPNKSYALSETNGPWMILAATFRSERAQHDAQELVYELRKRYKLAAYTHAASFDYGGRLRGRGYDPFGNPKVMRHRDEREHIDEVAVLVGDFQSIDDADAQKALQKLKRLFPRCLTNDTGDAERPAIVSRPLAGWREMVRRANLSLGDERGELGPLASAFIVPNPLLPKNYFVPDGVDRFVEGLNSGLEFSVLNCPGRYTVRVATFMGSQVIKQKESLPTDGDDEMSNRLEKAAADAHNLTIALRKKGYEAYEFHDRHRSIVTVGSFDVLGVPQQDGTVNRDPRILKLQQAFSAEQTVVYGAGKPQAGQPKSLDGIPFDIRSTIMEVPRRSFSSDYARGSLGAR